jgi:preprotein translocase subunit SecG
MLTVLYVLFTVVAIFLGGIILLQEGKGGGLGSAFGGAGGEAFGHGAGGVNKLTSILAGLFIVLAVVIALYNKPKTTIGAITPAMTIDSPKPF